MTSMQSKLKSSCIKKIIKSNLITVKNILVVVTINHKKKRLESVRRNVRLFTKIRKVYRYDQVCGAYN